MKELFVELSDKRYPIYIEKGLFGRLGKEISAIHKGKKIAAVTDENLALIYGEALIESLTGSGTASWRDERQRFTASFSSGFVTTS